MGQPTAYEPVSNYSQHRFVLIDKICELSEPTVPFPDMRSPSTRITDLCGRYFKINHADTVVPYESVEASCAVVKVTKNRLVYIYHSNANVIGYPRTNQ
jgi:hypothetical protein